MFRTLYHVTFAVAGLAFVLAVVATGVEWSQAPADLFAEPGNIHWFVVLATLQSWLWPAVLLLLPPALLIAGVYARLRAR